MGWEGREEHSQNQINLIENKGRNDCMSDNKAVNGHQTPSPIDRAQYNFSGNGDNESHS